MRELGIGFVANDGGWLRRLGAARPGTMPVSRDSALASMLEELAAAPAKTTVVDVARALGMSHANVYRHFESKAALMDALVERWLTAVYRPLGPRAATINCVVQRRPALPILRIAPMQPDSAQ